MTPEVEVSSLTAIPLSNRSERGDEQSPNPSQITHRVTVMEAQDASIHVQVEVIPLGDDELHPLLVLEVFSEVVVHQVFEGVTLLGGVALILREAPMIPHTARDDEFHLRL